MPDDRVHDLYPRLVDATDEVLCRRGAAGHDVNIDLEPGAGEPDRRPNALLFVHDKILRQHVEDLAAGGQRDRPRRINGATHIVSRNFAVLARHRNDAPAVEALDVRAADSEVDAADLDARHQLSFFDRPLDRLDRRIEVYDDTAFEPLGFGHAETDHIDATFVEQLADNRANLRRADVQPDYVAFMSCQPALRLRTQPSCRLPFEVVTARHPSTFTLARAKIPGRANFSNVW